MDVLSSVLLFLLAATGVALVGIFLAKAADKLGADFQLGRSLSGFILLAAATSLPELIVSSQVAWTGAIDMAVGSLLGSCLINLLIVAGIDLSRRSHGRMLSRIAAAHALSALSSILLASIVAIAVLVPVMPEIGNLHSGSLLLCLVYILTIRMVFLDQRLAVTEITKSDSSSPPETITRGKSILVFSGATLVLLLLSSPLANTSSTLATTLNLSGTFFGAVFLALVTSLPEAMTTYQSVRMNAEDMAIGNILGSNTFNLMILVVLDLISTEPLFSQLSTAHAIAALGIILTTTVATMGLLYRVEKRIWYLEPDAVSVILLSSLFFYLIYIL